MALDKALKSRLDKIDKIRTELQKAEKSASKEIMDMLKELMANNPMLEAMRWHQYTPSFNDGEPCEFSIGELEFKFSDNINSEANNKAEYSDDEDSDDDSNSGFYDSYSIDDFLEKKTDILNHKEMSVLKKAIKDANKVFSKLCEMESQLETMFGTNMEITVTKDGIETENYDCGY